jgi:thiol-disulfide isomerase/thioredoxin
VRESVAVSMKKTFRIAVASLLLAVPIWASAQTPVAPTLHIGDPAPPLVVGQWLKGGPINQFASNQAYIVVFWATWSPAFMNVMQHLDELEARHSDHIKIIAVSVFEDNQAKPIGFVNHFADKMDFTVAYDQVPDTTKHGLDGTMATTWLEASQQSGVPIAFIVDHAGKIAWIGTPAGNVMDDPLRKIIDNSWDSAAFAAEFTSKQERGKATQDIVDKMALAIRANDWDGALKLADELIPYDKSAAAAARYLTMLRKGDFEAAYAYAKQLAAGPFSKDATAIYSLGWITVNPEEHYDKTDYDLGLALAKQAVELSYHKSAEMLDLLAWAYYQKKDKGNAISSEQEALAIARDDQKFRLQQSLRTFQAG